MPPWRQQPLPRRTLVLPLALLAGLGLLLWGGRPHHRALPNGKCADSGHHCAPPATPLRSAYMAARSYHATTGSYTGYSPAQQHRQEPALHAPGSGSAPADTISLFQSNPEPPRANGFALVPGPAGIRPITDRDPFRSGSTVLILCWQPPKRNIYCVADSGRYSSYGRLGGARSLILADRPAASLLAVQMRWGPSF